MTCQWLWELLLSAMNYIDLDDALLMGELALDGALRHTNGIYPSQFLPNNAE